MRLSLSLVCLAALTVSASAQTSTQTLGQKYHTREPHTCASLKEPLKGPLSNAQATQYLTCRLEHEGSREIFLSSDVKVEVGKGTPFRDLSTISKPGRADVDGIVYSIRGSYKSFQCSRPSSAEMEGHNCNRYDNAKAEGICYRDNFGDWICSMRDGYAKQTIQQPPPP